MCIVTLFHSPLLCLFRKIFGTKTKQGAIFLPYIVIVFTYDVVCVLFKFVIN